MVIHNIRRILFTNRILTTQIQIRLFSCSPDDAYNDIGNGYGKTILMILKWPLSIHSVLRLFPSSEDFQTNYGYIDKKR